MVEAGLERKATIFRLAVTGHRDQDDCVSVWSGSNCPGQLIAVHVRQADIDEGNLGLGQGDRRQRLLPVGRDGHFMPLSAKQRGQQAAGVGAVFDQQDAARVTDAPAARSAEPANDRRRSGNRTTNSLLLARGPSLCAVIEPPCISTRLRTTARPIPKPPCDRTTGRLASKS